MLLCSDDLLPDPVGTCFRPIVGGGDSGSGGNIYVGVSIVQTLFDQDHNVLKMTDSYSLCQECSVFNQLVNK